jgi:hypothetical protein
MQVNTIPFLTTFENTQSLNQLTGTRPFVDNSISYTIQNQPGNFGSDKTENSIWKSGLKLQDNCVAITVSSNQDNDYFWITDESLNRLCLITSDTAGSYYNSPLKHTSFFLPIGGGMRIKIRPSDEDGNNTLTTNFIAWAVRVVQYLK